MAKNKIITVQDVPITVSISDEQDYICTTDMAAAKSNDSRAADVIRNWLRNRSTLEFLSTWEEIYNPNFKVFESEHFKKDVGLVTFTPSVSEWVAKTDAIGMFVKKGRYGGTFAHKDIAFEFASAISPVFKLYLIKEFQRLKMQEQPQSLKRIMNYPDMPDVGYMGLYGGLDVDDIHSRKKLEVGQKILHAISDKG
ncbi:MAG: KilA-N domain-containing protein [Lachnospiraceae bacterium]|nr:KilA-N domain-containing protein [Lachnospiraceae bacterium]